MLSALGIWGAPSPAANGLFSRGFGQRFALHASARTAVKLDFICGLLLRATEMQQRSSFRDVQTALGELIGMRHHIWALSTATAADAHPGPGGYLLPNTGYALQWRNVYGDMFTRARTLFQNVLSGNLIQIPSSAEDFKNPALRSFAQVFAAELLPRGIRVNTVGPGFIMTPTMGVAGLSEEEKAAFMKLGDEITPMKRHGTVEEVARAALFLAFDATFTTGVELLVDGGLAQVAAPHE